MLKSLFFFFLCISFAYSGTIKCKISFKKKPPKLGLIYMSEDHSLQDVPVVDQKGKKFMEPLYVGAKGQEMVFKNSDEVSHNIFAQDTKLNVNFDVGLMAVGATQKKAINWEKGKVVRMSCKIHPKMRTYVASVDSKYHKVLKIPKKKVYSFSLEGVPDNLSEVTFWFSSKWDPITVKVAKGEKKKVEMTKKKKKAAKLEITHE